MCDRDDWQQVGKTARKIVERLAGGNAKAGGAPVRLDAGRIARLRWEGPHARNDN